MKRNIAFIGTVGVPNNYGGFEMFLESCAPEIAKSFDTVIVTCDATRYDDRQTAWHGIERVFIPIRANGALSVFHDLLAFIAVFWRAHAIVVLGVSGGIFFPIFRLVSSVFGKVVIVNVDGVEWRRGKFSLGRRAFLYLSDRLAQIFAHKVIVDNGALRPFLFAPVRDAAALIAYPGDHVQRLPKVSARPNEAVRCLTICRIEPENNIHLLIEAFSNLSSGTYTFVGNWDASEYGRELRLRFADVVGLEMRNPVYAKDVLVALREECTHYLHGHSVGGTNPSLVEMLFYDCSILAYDCPFNRCTGGEAISYFADTSGLSTAIKLETIDNAGARAAIRLKYTRSRICKSYVDLIKGLMGVPALVTARTATEGSAAEEV